MIICALFIVACFGNLFSECKTVYDKEIKFKPNQDAKIHIFVSLSLAFMKSRQVKFYNFKFQHPKHHQLEHHLKSFKPGQEAKIRLFWSDK